MEVNLEVSEQFTPFCSVLFLHICTQMHGSSYNPDRDICRLKKQSMYLSRALQSSKKVTLPLWSSSGGRTQCLGLMKGLMNSSASSVLKIGVWWEMRGRTASSARNIGEPVAENLDVTQPQLLNGKSIVVGLLTCHTSAQLATNVWSKTGSSFWFFPCHTACLLSRFFPRQKMEEVGCFKMKNLEIPISSWLKELK